MLLGVLAASTATAEPLPWPGPRAVAAVSAPGQEHPTLIGPSGQIYRPSAPDTWTRTLPGGVAADVAGALVTPEGRVFVGGAAAPLYELGERAWRVHLLPNRGTLILAAGGPAVAVHTHVHAWSAGAWKRVTTLDSPVTALWAGPRGELMAATRRGEIARQRGASWPRLRVPLASGDSITHLLGHDAARVHAITASGAIFAVSGSRAEAVTRDPALASLIVHAAAAAPDGSLWVAGRIPAPPPDQTPPAAVAPGLVLARVQGQTLELVEPIAELPPDDQVTVLAPLGQGALVVTSAQGFFRIRNTPGTWKSATIVTDLASAAWRGPPAGPARTR